jgi:hypothetical protein
MNQLLGLGSSPFGLGTNQPDSGLTSLLSGCIKSSQNEQRLMAENSQRNLLKKYLTQATGDPIQSALISKQIPGRGYGDTLDVGLGTRSSIMQSLGLSSQPTQSTGLLGNLTGLGNTATQGAGLMSTLGGLGGLGNNTNNTLGTLSTLGNIANLGKSSSANTGLLSSLVGLASTPNNTGNIFNSLGGLGSGLLGNTASSGTGVLGNIQSGINTLNTLNKVNNAVQGVKNLF